MLSRCPLIRNAKTFVMSLYITFHNDIGRNYSSLLAVACLGIKVRKVWFTPSIDSFPFKETLDCCNDIHSNYAPQFLVKN